MSIGHEGVSFAPFDIRRMRILERADLSPTEFTLFLFGRIATCRVAVPAVEGGKAAAEATMLGGASSEV
jgi:hypothetical protein